MLTLLAETVFSLDHVWFLHLLLGRLPFSAPAHPIYRGSPGEALFDLARRRRRRRRRPPPPP
jgi:hypothetical protein